MTEVEEILEAAKQNADRLTDIVVVGRGEDGNIFSCHSTMRISDVIALLEYSKLHYAVKEISTCGCGEEQAD